MDNRFQKYGQVATVPTFDELIHTKFQGKVNAICWHRKLIGNFEELVAKLQLKENITVISVEDLSVLSLSKEGEMAREIVLSDLKLLEDAGAQPVLNLLKSYDRDEEFDFISTDVYSYHVDRSPIAADTFLCTYYGAASDILPNDQVDQQVLIPETRRKLQELHHGSEEEFDAFLATNFFDLHYQPKPNAKPLNLGVGHLWKLAVDHPEQRVLPCVHRAPMEKQGEYRLLLIC